MDTFYHIINSHNFHRGQNSGGYGSKALKMYIIFDSAIHPLGIYLQGIMMMFLKTRLLGISSQLKHRRQFKCTAMGNCFSKLSIKTYVHAV